MAHDRKLREEAARVSARERELAAARDELLQHERGLKDELRARLAEQAAEMAERVRGLEELDADLAKRERRFEGLDAELAKRERQLEARDAELTERDRRLEAHATGLGGREAEVARAEESATRANSEL